MAMLAALPRPSMTKNDGFRTSPQTFAGAIVARSIRVVGGGSKY